VEQRTLSTLKLEASSPLNFRQATPNTNALAVPQSVCQTFILDNAVGADGLGLAFSLNAHFTRLFFLRGEKEAGVD